MLRLRIEGRFALLNAPLSMTRSSLLRGNGRFRLRVQLINLLFVAIFDNTPTQFQGWRESAVVDGEFVFYQHDALQFFEAGQILIDALDHPFVQAPHFRIRDQFCAR